MIIVQLLKVHKDAQVCRHYLQEVIVPLRFHVDFAVVQLVHHGRFAAHGQGRIGVARGRRWWGRSVARPSHHRLLERNACG